MTAFWIATVVLSGYPLASRVASGTAARWVASAILGIIGVPALVWIACLGHSFVSPHAIVLALAAIGAAAWWRTAPRTPEPGELTLDLQLIAATAAVVVVQGLVCLTSGFYNGNLYLAVFHAHDGLVHLANAAMMRPSREFSIPWPPPTPFWGDDLLVNYHPSSDVLLALLAAHDDQPMVYFRVFPVLASCLFCLSFAWLFSSWGATPRIRALGVAVSGLTSSLGHLTRLAGWHAVDSWTESHFWMSQLHSMNFNPPFAFSLSAAALGLTLIPRSRRHPLSTTTAIAVVFGLGFAMKSFMSIVMTAGLCWAVLVGRGLRLRLLLILAGTGICAVLAMAATTRDVRGAVAWAPFWPVYSLPERLGIPTLPGHFGFFVLLSAFFLGNLGIRVLGFARWARALVGRAECEPAPQAAAAGATVAALALPLMFATTGGVAVNTIQFGYYALAFTGIWCTWPLAGLLFEARRPVRILSTVFVVVLALPGTVRTLTLLNSGMLIPRSEIKALHSLGQTMPPRALIFAMPDPSRRPNTSRFRPPADATETSYVAALSGHPVYFADVLQLKVMRLPWRARYDEIADAVGSNDKLHAMLDRHQIKVVYRAGDPPTIERVP